jgi:superfamily II DNA or RNA helicase
MSGRLPRSLAEQWQDELYRRFHLKFDILTNDKLKSSATGNWFRDTNLAIARLDKLSRNDDVQAKLLAPDCQWDLVVCDEAHKMSATVFGGEVKYTKRYKLGQLLSGVTRHFLLMTATPHNGKEEDFQLFMALLDGDRFANTLPYKLSDAEAQLYKMVTDYVRQEWRKADDLQNDKRANTVGFALTMLQRRLASSVPEAIYQSLRRRRERLEKRLREVELMHRAALLAGPSPDVPELDADEVDDLEVATGRS